MKTIQWDYKIQLDNLEVFEKIESQNTLKVPEDLKRFIIDNNGAYPTPNCVDINGVERVYDATLSFNEDDNVATTVFEALKIVDNPDYIPFAQDPFGNYFCYDWKNETISFYSNEESIMDDTDLNLEMFLKSLHEMQEE